MPDENTHILDVNDVVVMVSGLAMKNLLAELAIFDVISTDTLLMPIQYIQIEYLELSQGWPSYCHTKQ